jgi:transposase-like protein
MNKWPETLQEAIQYFSDPDNTHNFMVAMRWPDGKVRCPQCDAEKVTYLAKQRRWKCYGKHPKAQFSAKVGTIFEDSPLGLDKWLPAAWLICNCKNGVSSYELSRDLGVTQKSAWFMLHRIRVAMKTGSFKKLSGHANPIKPFHDA